MGVNDHTQSDAYQKALHDSNETGKRDKNYYRASRYFIDCDGFLWRGPVDCQNLHWSRLEGFGNGGWQIWVCSRSYPSSQWAEITPYQAAVHIKQEFDHWWTNKAK